MSREKQQKDTPLEQQQPYDNALKSLLEGQEAQLLPQFLPGANNSVQKCIQMDSLL